MTVCNFISWLFWTKYFFNEVLNVYQFYHIKVANKRLGRRRQQQRKKKLKLNLIFCCHSINYFKIKESNKHMPKKKEIKLSIIIFLKCAFKKNNNASLFTEGMEREFV